MSRIGIMGGTFNPIHWGHLLMAEYAYEQMKLDTVWFMPNKNPMYKSIQGNIREEDRVAMIRLAIEDNPHFQLNTMELERDGGTYTVDTLEILKKEQPADEFFFLMGTDSLIQFPSWKNPGRIAQLATLLVASRNTKITPEQIMEQAFQLYQNYHATVLHLHYPLFAVSSSDIRKRRGEGLSIRYTVPKKVEDYIYAHGLYQPGDRQNGGSL